jgi:hypothetical protein
MRWQRLPKRSKVMYDYDRAVDYLAGLMRSANENDAAGSERLAAYMEHAIDGAARMAALLLAVDTEQLIAAAKAKLAQAEA